VVVDSWFECGNAADPGGCEMNTFRHDHRTGTRAKPTTEKLLRGRICLSRSIYSGSGSILEIIAQSVSIDIVRSNIKARRYQLGPIVKGPISDSSKIRIWIPLATAQYTSVQTSSFGNELGRKHRIPL
jgi:hypothetical protein